MGRVYSNKYNFSPFDLGVECERSADSLNSVIENIEEYTDNNVLTDEEFDVLLQAYQILVIFNRRKMRKI